MMVDIPTVKRCSQAIGLRSRAGEDRMAAMSFAEGTAFAESLIADSDRWDDLGGFNPHTRPALFRLLALKGRVNAGEARWLRFRTRAEKRELDIEGPLSKAMDSQLWSFALRRRWAYLTAAMVAFQGAYWALRAIGKPSVEGFADIPPTAALVRSAVRGVGAGLVCLVVGVICLPMLLLPSHQLPKVSLTESKKRPSVPPDR